MRTLEWYCWRRGLGLPAVPTLAHAALDRAQERLGERWAGCHTQNVDGLHEAAGNRGVNRIHGSIWCWRDPRTHALSFDPSDRVEDIPMDGADSPRVRPGVVMFGDTVPSGVYERAIAEALRAEVALVVGTSAQVSTLWPLLHAAMQGGAQLVEVNPEPSPVTYELGAIALPLPSGVGVPLALEAVGALTPDDTDALARTPRTSLRDALPRLEAEFVADR
jgi:NAD-dependent deacetylase